MMGVIIISTVSLKTHTLHLNITAFLKNNKNKKLIINFVNLLIIYEDSLLFIKGYNY
jgi:hypothetical protein